MKAIGISERNSMRIIEGFAVVFNLLYTLLYIRESALCWPFAFVGSILFVFLCFKKKLLAETALQVFYVLFAVYGYVSMGASWEEHSWLLSTHLGLIFSGAILCLISWQLLKRLTQAELPLLDSFTTIFSLIATWVMVNFVHENWLYWIIIDFVSIYLYAKRGMYFGALLFVIYLLLAINGYWNLGWVS